MRPHPSLILLLTSVLLCTASGCSLRYDADELPRKTDATGGDDPDASGVDPADASQVEPADASPDQPDAAPLPDAAVHEGSCGDVGEECCEDDPPCGFGDQFIECNEETSMCENCGRDSEQCCETGEECQSSLLGCLLEICTPL